MPTLDEIIQEAKSLSREEVSARFHASWVEIGKRNAHIPEEEVVADIELASAELRFKEAVEELRLAQSAESENSARLEQACDRYKYAKEKLRVAIRDWLDPKNIEL